MKTIQEELESKLVAPEVTRKFRTVGAGLYKMPLGVDVNGMPVAINFAPYYEDGNYSSPQFSTLTVSPGQRLGVIKTTTGKISPFSEKLVLEVILSSGAYDSGKIVEDIGFYKAELSKKLDREIEAKMAKLEALGKLDAIDTKIEALDKSIQGLSQDEGKKTTAKAKKMEAVK